MKKAIIAVVVFLVFSLNSCEQSAVETPSLIPSPTITNRFTEGGLLSKEPCAPPCFFGITPGFTTEEEARSIIEQKEMFENCEDFDTSSVGGNSQGIRCNFFVVYFVDAMVNDLAFYPADEMTLKEIIAEYGEPNRLFTYSSSTPDNPLYGDLSLCFEDLYMIIDTPSTIGEVYRTSEETRVLAVSYLSSEDQYTRICSGLGGSQLWEGYGDYPVYFVR